MTDQPSQPSEPARPNRRVVRVERKVTVVTYALAENYVTGRRGETVPMTDSQILDTELALSPEDSFNSLIEAGSVADESDIDQSCKVEFLNEADMPDDIRRRVV